MVFDKRLRTWWYRLRHSSLLHLCQSEHYTRVLEIFGVLDQLSIMTMYVHLRRWNSGALGRWHNKTQLHHSTWKRKICKNDSTYPSCTCLWSKRRIDSFSKVVYSHRLKIFSCSHLLLKMCTNHRWWNWTSRTKSLRQNFHLRSHNESYKKWLWYQQSSFLTSLDWQSQWD